MWHQLTLPFLYTKDSLQCISDIVLNGDSFFFLSLFILNYDEETESRNSRGRPFLKSKSLPLLKEGCALAKPKERARLSSKNSYLEVGMHTSHYSGYRASFSCGSALVEGTCKPPFMCV